MKKMLVFLLLMVVTFASGQDTIPLTDVSITASRFKMEAISGKVIYTDSIKKNYFAQETPSIFASTPSITSQSDNGTQFGYAYLTLRGMGQNRINYTLNGIPLNDGEDLAVYTSNFTDLISSVNSVQIVRGAGVSSNGSSSLAGVINFELNSPFVEKSGEFEATTGSFNSYRVSGKYNFGTKNGFGATLRVSSMSTDGFRDFSNGKSQSFSTSFGYKNDKTTAVFNIIQGFTKNGQYWLPVPEGMPVKTNLLTEMGVKPQNDDFVNGIYQFQFNNRLTSSTTLNTSVYVTTINGNYDFPSFTENNYIKNLELNSENFGGYANVKYRNYGLSLETGANFNRFNRTHIGSSEFLTDSYINRGYKNDYAGYLKSSYRLNDFILEADLQLRNTSFTYEAPNLYTEVFDHTFFNYSTGVSYQGLESVKPYARFSRSNREPSRTNIFGDSDHYTLENISDLNNVRPESVNDFELGTKVKSGRLEGNFNLYAMLFNDEIISTGQLNSMGVSQGKNGDKSERLGVEVDFTYNLNKFNIGGNLNASKNTVWMDGNKSNPLSSPGFISNVMLMYKPNNFSIGTQYKYVTYSYLDNENKFVLPEYNLVDVNVGYDFNKASSIKLFVNNVLDRNMTLAGSTDGISRSFYYSSGINIFTTFSYKF